MKHDYKMKMAIHEAKKRGALLGTMETIDWFLTNDLADIEKIHEMIKEAIRKDKNDENQKYD